MSKPQEPSLAKLVVGILFSDENLFSLSIKELEFYFGPVQSIHGPKLFNHTSYYIKEMGDNLKKSVLVFKNLVKRDELNNLKLKTNEIENKISFGDKRKVNIDPGILTLENFILASCKGYSHRVYISKGVFADLTLIYINNTYKTLQWTYPDFSSEEMIMFLNETRKTYKKELEKS